MNTLENIVQRKNQNKKESFFELKITSYAYKKIKEYAHLACDLAKSNIECYGYLISPEGENEGIVKDAFLAINQDVEDIKCVVNPESKMESMRMIYNQGYKTVGWWHSHGGMNPFHSDKDNRNFKKIYKTVFTHNKIDLKSKEDELLKNPVNINFEEDEDNRYIILSKDKFSDRIKIKVNEIPELKDLKIKGISVTKYRGISIAYSLVVNRFYSQGYYAEVALRFPWEDKTIIKKGIKINELELEMINLNYDKIVEDVKTRIIHNGRFLGSKKIFGGLNYKQN